MRMLAFSNRNLKEIVRDPLTVAFSLGFPLVLLLLLSAIQANITVPMFEIETLAPGMCIFGLTFMTLFSATLIARDRETSFLRRLYTTPMRAGDFICGYMLPIIPISVGQSAVCYAAAFALGLKPDLGVLWSLLSIVPVSLFFIALGLLCGSLLTVKQVAGLCGALLTNLAAWLSGIWFDLALVGGAFRDIAYALPFVHAVELERGLVSGSGTEALLHVGVLAGYTVLAIALAVAAFLRKMHRE